MPAKKLKKELKFMDVFAIAIGTTLSGGFFLLPGIAAESVGSGIELVYALAIIPLIPAMVSQIELATAMPKAGGVYYFLDRALGPFVGTIGGIGIWIVLILKIAFALIGMGAYLKLFFPEIEIVPIALSFAVILGALNLYGAKKTTGLQIILAFSVLIVLVLYSILGFSQVDLSHFEGFLDADYHTLLGTAGVVYVSYIGVMKVVSLAEEVENPERNLPLGIFWGMGVALVLYVVGTYIMVGVVNPNELEGNLTLVASAAQELFGQPGLIIISIAALFSFLSVANAGVLSASRYPLAMSRDRIMPSFFDKYNRFGSPHFAIIVTVGLVIVILLLLDPSKIAKLASVYLLLMFALLCLCVIVMRESHIASYDPGYRSPLYPWMHIFGILMPLWIVSEMGALAILFSLGMILISVLWYYGYGRKHVSRGGAIYHWFARMGEQRYEGLDRELRGILKEKGLRTQDPFESLVAHATILDVDLVDSFESLLDEVSTLLHKKMGIDKAVFLDGFSEGEVTGITPVGHGVALPHMRLPNISPEMVLVRIRKGLQLVFDDEYLSKEFDKPIQACFFLISPEEEPQQHLRILAQIAGRVDHEGFMEEWLGMQTEQQLKEVLLRDEHFYSFTVKQNHTTKSLINKALKSIQLPESCLITMIYRNGSLVIPRGHTILEVGDVVTIIGEPQQVRKLYKQFG